MSSEESLNQVFMALADATRRQLVKRLAKSECSLSDLAEPFDMSFAAVSKHLKVLEKSGIISRRIEGRHHFFSLVPEQLTEALDWVSVYRNFWQSRLDAMGAMTTPGDADDVTYTDHTVIQNTKTTNTKGEE